ncbi:hypothetical protein [Ramlibacter sp.]|uniref:hypothetical protein n=1 Tax=Ramlibacter sp. TaxID=1917967 RepID=UPI002D3CCD9E|nr:hypothetical protein [Ramlibacter sp.]HYD74808.1 hypothetical protein [Ramlibacter sp.]
MTPLRIGFASVYAWRPHVEQMMFLARLVQQAGHEALFLACDSDLPACYTRLLRDVRPDWMECAMCRAGGVRSYAGSHVTAIGALQPEPGMATKQAREWAASSASTLGRFEAPAEYESEEFLQLRDRLAPAVAKAYAAASEWIRRERLDALCLFNGRMDATRAILEAARAAGIRVLSFERTWFGDGLQLLPDEHCLGLQSVWRLVSEWKDRPLTREQATRAAELAARRFLRRNHTEWRAYNVNAVATPWPVAAARRKVLFLPSSNNEIWGHEDWRSGWGDPMAAMEGLMARLELSPSDIVLRCHPNWAERIGKNDGRRPEQFYTRWAQGLGIHVIPSADPTSTMHLIEQCELLVLQSGSAAFEAGVLGKRIVTTTPSTYHLGGFTENVHRPDDLAHLDPLQPALPPERAREVTRRALRFGYTMAYRIAQYTRALQATSSSAYRYADRADPDRLMRLLATGTLEPDDAAWAPDLAGEGVVLEAIARRDWGAFGRPAAPADAGPARGEPVQRRLLFRPIDRVRGWMQVGDR